MFGDRRPSFNPGDVEKSILPHHQSRVPLCRDDLCVALALYRGDMPSSITDCVRVYGYEARLVDFQKGTKEIEWPVD